MENNNTKKHPKNQRRLLTNGNMDWHRNNWYDHFLDNAQKGTEEIAKKYIKKLMNYTDILETMNELGTKMEFKSALQKLLNEPF